jgi:hypothetical protein
MATILDKYLKYIKTIPEEQLIEELKECGLEDYLVKYNKVNRHAKEGELIEIIKTGEIKEVRIPFMGGVHINDFYFTSYLDNEYLVLEPKK